MREIKFRGLRPDGSFVYGLPTHDLPNTTAYYNEYSYRLSWHPESGGRANAPVKNGTLGQFTGLQDKNGVDIYEGDLINVFFTSPDGEGEFIHDCIYSVSINSLGGASLNFVKLLWEDKGNNQYPIHTTLNSDELELDWLVKERNKLVLKVTHGENKMFNQRWITNNESRYFVNIGNIHQNPELV